MITAESIKARLKYRAQKEGRIVQKFDFDGEELKIAISETFTYRKTKLEYIAAFEYGFADDPYRKQRWNGFLKSKSVRDSITLEEIIEELKCFLIPVIEAVVGQKKLDLEWSHEQKKWRCCLV